MNKKIDWKGILITTAYLGVLTLGSLFFTYKFYMHLSA